MIYKPVNFRTGHELSVGHNHITTVNEIAGDLKGIYCFDGAHSFYGIVVYIQTDTNTVVS